MLGAGSIQRVLAVLRVLEDKYRAQDCLPKELVGVMLDTSTALYSAAASHSKEEQRQLFQQFDLATSRMRDLCR